MSNGITVDPALVTPSLTGLSQVERVVDTFIAPSKTFTDILRNTSWWLPFLLLLLSTVASSYVVQKQVGFDRVYTNMMHDSPKAEDRINQMDPAQKAKMLSIGETQVKLSSYGAFVFLLIFFALYALIVWASFNFGLGARTTYPQVFAVTFYAALPYLLLSLLTIITLYAGGNAEAYDVKNPVGTNPAYYMADAAPWLKSILSSLDVVKIWSNVLMVIGMAIVARKTIMQSAVIIGVLWLLGVALQTVGAAFS
jgi:hypothetical protein